MIEIVTQPPMKIEPLPVKDWRDQPETPGAWRWALVNGQSTALFIGADEKQIAMLKCDPAKGTILLARPGVGEPPMGLMVRTTSMAPLALAVENRAAQPEGTDSDTKKVQCKTCCNRANDSHLGARTVRRPAPRPQPSTEGEWLNSAKGGDRCLMVQQGGR